MKHGIVHGLVMLLLTLVGAPDTHAGRRAPMPAETVLRDSVTRLSAGDNHTCHVVNDGTVRCWGYNFSGQLGDGTTTDGLTPVAVSGLTSAIAIAAGGGAPAGGAGGGHTCALLADGTARCWGSNFKRQLGDGTVTDRLTPVAVSGLTGAVALAAGALHTCALLADGTARCWGANGAGQLGDGTVTDRPTPVTVIGLTNAVALAAGQDHTCALRADGTARCWGGNQLGQLGDGTTTNQFTPVAVSGLTDAVAIAAGGGHTCALRADAFALCWGSNFSGQLGVSPTPPRLTPVLTSELSGVAITAGDRHTCALRSDGTARCRGHNGFGQLGGTGLPDAVSGLIGAVAIAAGEHHSCALRVDGTARCWGRNNVGQLGDGTTSDSATAVTVPGPVGSVVGKGMAAGGSHTCAVRAFGGVSCWGDNDFGQLGDDTTTDRLTPVFVRPTSGVGVLSGAVAVAAGPSHTCALLHDGTHRCWGANGAGQLGDGTTTDRLRPVSSTRSGGAVALAAGDSHTCALTAAGGVQCWGGNDFGQLGDGTTTDRLTPAPVSGLANAIALAAGGRHTCALRADGTARCWGRNLEGQVGVSPFFPRLLTPVAVSGLTNAIALAAGGRHTCALLADGTARCWGANGSGQLGDGTLTPRFTPAVAVSGLTNAIALAAGGRHTCALLADGTARCWGANGSGQLGDGTTTPRLTPTPVTTVVQVLKSLFGAGEFVVNLGTIVQITTGGSHTCALRAHGAVFCWGENFSGQVGDDTTIDRLRAVVVPSFTFNLAPLVTLPGKRREALVTVLATCEAGQELQVTVRLTQGAASGHGLDHFECTGALERFPVRVHAQGRQGFAPGPAQAEAEAIIRDRGRVVDEQEWTRAVEIVDGP